MTPRLSDQKQVIPYDASLPARQEAPKSSPYLDGNVQQGEVTLGAYWDIIWRRRWTVLICALALTTVVTIISFRMQPVYKAIARVEVSSENPQMESLQSFYQQLPTNQDFLRTQIQVIRTDNLAWRTVEQLRLDEEPGFGPAQGSAQQRKMALIGRFESLLSCELIPGSRVIQVGFESTDPDLAARVANALVNNYVDYNFQQQYDATRQASGRMEQQLDELKAKVEKSQQALVDYERQNSIVTVSDKQNVIEQRLGELSTDLTNAQNDRIQKEALYQQVQTSPDQASALADNTLLQRLQENYSTLHNEYVEAKIQYGPTFPKVIRLQSQVAEAQVLIDKERSRVVDKIHGEYLAAVGRERMLTQAVAQQKEAEGKLNQLLVQHNILKGEFETNQQLYQRLQQQLKDATVAAGLRSTNIHFVDPALAPTVPARPRKVLNISIGLMLGLVFGIMLAFVQEALDTSIKGPEEIEMILSIPTLAIVPAQRVSSSSRQLRGRGDRRSPPTVAVLRNSNSALAEAYRALRTSTLVATSPDPPRAVLITSTNAGEGKTSTAVNLAVTLAQRGGPVALLDCDLRRPSIGGALHMSTDTGLAAVLGGTANSEEAFQQFTAVPDLWVMPAGPVPANPAELLASEAMQTLLNDLGKRFKHIIIDSPPILAVTDPIILSTMVDGVILVLESGVTPKKMITRACRVLENAGAVVLGVVLNKYDVNSEGYYGGYYRNYYTRYYGKDPE